MLCWQYLGYTPTVHEDMGMQVWAEEVLHHSRRNVTNEIFMVAWTSWKNRNDMVWQQKGKDYEEILKSGVQVLNNWESAQDKSFDSTIGFLTQPDGGVHWRQPHQGAVKVNTYATIFEESNYYSYAMVARDHTGTLLEAQASCKQGILNPDLAEAIGIREALSWLKFKDWEMVEVETDCMGAVQAIRCSSINFSYPGRVIYDCRRLLVDLKEIDPETAGPTQVKEQTAGIATDLKDRGDQEQPKQSTLKPKWPKDLSPSDEELELLERETAILQAKLERQREIHRLRRELHQASIRNQEQDDELYDEDDDVEYEYEPSAESTYSQPCERRQHTVSTADVITPSKSGI
ncbi:hypothetical protein AgCh_020058 [Apium graveolens]